MRTNEEEDRAQTQEPHTPPVRVDALSKWATTLNVASFSGALTILGVLFVLGPHGQTVSADENRTLSPVPEFTWEGLFEGDYTRRVEAWVADHFPRRNNFIEVANWLKEQRGLSVDETFYAVTIQEGIVDADWDAESVDSEQEVPDWQPASTPELFPAAEAIVDEPSVEMFAGPPVPQAVSAESAPSKKAKATPKGAATKGARKSNGIYIYGGRAMQGFRGSPNGARKYTELMNSFRQKVGDSADMYVLLFPSPQEFYLPDKYRQRSKREKPNIQATYALLNPTIKPVDAYSELAAHQEEYLYYRTDHHWTGLGAYYAYRAFCTAADLEPMPLSQMAKRTGTRSWLGSLHRLTKDPSLRENRDRTDYHVPPVSVKVTRYQDDGQKIAREVPLFRENAFGYLVFLGGDAPMLRVETGVKNGKRAILIKNSYGNAFAPYLVSHYEELIFLDYRRFTGRVMDLIESRTMKTDLIFLNGILSANGPHHIRSLGKMLYGANQALEPTP